MAEPVVATQAGMRRQNLALVMRAVAERGPLSRADVAGAVGLTRAAVSTLVEELLGAGLLDEAGATRARARVGRPGTALTLRRHGPAGLGADIGVDHLAACAVDLRGTVRAHRQVLVDNRGRAPEDVLAAVADLVGRVAADAEADGARPVGLVVAVPGLVGPPEDGLVARAPNLGWTELPAGPMLRRALPPELAGLPLRVDNEADLGALAELWLCRPPGDFLHVSMEIGIGAALVVDGRLRRGARGFAGELGHVPVHPNGPSCPCGSRGCLEQYAGEEAILRAAGIDPARAARTHPGPSGRTRLLASRAESGDPAARGALRRAGASLGIALAGTVNLLDPSAIVLGGGFGELSRWLLPPLTRELTGRLPSHAPDRLLSVSVPGREGPLLGAATTTVREIVDDPVGFLRR